MIGTWSWDDDLAQQDPQAYLVELTSALRTILAPGDGVDMVVLLQFPQVGPVPYIFDPLTQAATWTKQNARQIIWNDVAARGRAVLPRPGHVPPDRSALRPP